MTISSPARSFDHVLRWLSWSSFATGAGFGVMIVLAWQHGTGAGPATVHNPEQLHREYAEAMQSRLRLEPEQRRRLEVILNATQERVLQKHEQYKSALQEIRDDQYREIRGILTDGQQAEYERIRHEREQARLRNSGYR